MPDYLSPGVYIEELPPALRAIEGVSTSIAGFVGPAARGPVPGFPLPFNPVPPLALNPSPAPSLVTSFSDFVRQFGYPMPLPDPTNNSFLGYAVKGFFDNGGQVCYVSRVIPNDPTSPSTNATYGMVRLNQGVVLNLADDAPATEATLEFNTLRGVSVGSVLTFYHKSGSLVMNAANTAALEATVQSYNTQSISVVLSAPIGVALAASDVYAIPSGSVLNGEGPAFWARNPGQWSYLISVQVTPSRRRTVPITTPATANATEIQIASTSGFYNGAILEIDNGTVQTYNVVASMGAGFLKLTGNLGVNVVTGTVRIVEIDITLTDPTPAVPVVETYQQLTWNPSQDPNITARHYATAINAQSQLVYVQPPGLAGLNGSEAPDLSSQPITFNGWALNITDSSNAAGQADVVVQALQNLEGAVTAMGAATAVLLVTDPLYVAVQNATAALSAAVATADAVANAGTATAVTMSAALNAAVAATNNAISAANPVVAAALANPQVAGALAAAATTYATAAGLATTAITAATTATTSAFGAALLTPLTTAITHLSADVATLGATAAASLPLAANAPTVLAVLNDQAALTSEANGLTPLADTLTSGIFLSGSAIAATVGNAATSNEITLAINDANAAAATATTSPFNAATLAAEVASVSTEAGSAITAIQTAQTAAAADLPRLGSDGANPPSDDDYVGNDNGPGTRSGIQALLDVEAVSIIAAPGRTSPEVQNELIDQCELLRYYRFAVLDGLELSANESINDLLVHRDNYDTSYASYYVPWLQITVSNQNLFIPPSGHVIGIFSATDNSRGVWKAPANVVVQNITGLENYMNTGEQDILNPVGIDVIRRFDMLGIRVWGARTLSSDTSVQYNSVRRTLIFLEHSIDQGTQWVVFEPNTPDTWDRLTDSVVAFLTTQWTNGALFGDKPEDAFYVRCDETTMTADDIQNGRLICEIGVAIVRPAEFVIFRIQQTTGFANQ